MFGLFGFGEPRYIGPNKRDVAFFLMGVFLTSVVVLLVRW